MYRPFSKFLQNFPVFFKIYRELEKCRLRSCLSLLRIESCVRCYHFLFLLNILNFSRIFIKISLNFFKISILSPKFRKNILCFPGFYKMPPTITLEIRIILRHATNLYPKIPAPQTKYQRFTTRRSPFVHSNFTYGRTFSAIKRM